MLFIFLIFIYKSKNNCEDCQVDKKYISNESIQLTLKTLLNYTEISLVVPPS